MFTYSWLSCWGISRVVLKALMSDQKDEEEKVLTSREVEVLQLIAEGYTNKEIAKLLFITEKTVSNHRLNIMKKLDIHDVASLTRWAISQGIISENSVIRKRQPLRP